MLITNSESNPYGKFCNLQFVLPSDTQSVFKSRIVGFFFIELVLHLAYEKGEGEGNFEQLEELFVFLKPFHLFLDNDRFLSAHLLSAGSEWLWTTPSGHECNRRRL